MYSIQDSTATITGDLVQIPYQVSSYTSAEFDPGTTFELVPGARQSPLYVAVKAAKPKLTLEFNSAKEYWNAYLASGTTAIPGATSSISFVFFNFNVGLDDWEFTGGILPAPGFKIDDSGNKFKIEYSPVGVTLNGAPIYQS